MEDQLSSLGVCLQVAHSACPTATKHHIAMEIKEGEG